MFLLQIYFFVEEDLSGDREVDGCHFWLVMAMTPLRLSGRASARAPIIDEAGLAH